MNQNTVHTDPSLERSISTYSLLKFALPTIIANVAMGVFGVVDGVMAARIIDEYALSAVGLVMPFMMFVLAVGLMFGTGGNALIAKEIGEGLIEKARKNFSLVSLAGILSAVVLAIFAWLFPDLLFDILGIDDYMHDMTWEYAKTAIPFIPIIMAGILFQQFFMTEGKAHYGMIAVGTGGVVNIILNGILIPEYGLRGAALATCIGYSIPAVFGFIVFTFNRKGLLYFVTPKFNFSVLVLTSTNGMSEMVGSMAISISSIVMNNILMDLDGPMAVASAGIMMAGMNIMQGFFFGYTTGISPLISYNFGKKDHYRLKQIMNLSLWITSALTVITVALSWLFTDYFIQIYDIDPLVYISGFLMNLPVYEMAFDSLRILSFGYFFMGVNIFGSALFTALNNGIISGLIAFLRGIVFIIVCLRVLSAIWGVDGVWIAVPLAEVLGIFVTVYFLVKMRKIYHYA